MFPEISPLLGILPFHRKANYFPLLSLANGLTSEVCNVCSFGVERGCLRFNHDLQQRRMRRSEPILGNEEWGWIFSFFRGKIGILPTRNTSLQISCLVSYILLPPYGSIAYCVKRPIVSRNKLKNRQKKLIFFSNKIIFKFWLQSTVLVLTSNTNGHLSAIRLFYYFPSN